MLANLVRFDKFELDLGAYELRRSGQPMKLERIPMELLLLLVERRGELVTREQIKEKLWGQEVFVDTDNAVNTAIRKVRHTLGDDPDEPRFVQTVVGRGYRFIAQVEAMTAPALAEGKAAATHPTPTETAAPFPTPVPRRFSRPAKLFVPVLLLATGAGLLAGFRYMRPRPALSDRDVIVLADFTNNTVEPIFDDALQPALAVQLAQSPFLNILPEQRVRQALTMMQQAPTARLTHDLALQVCQRTNSTAVLQGSISRIGSRYSLTLNTVNCSNGKALANALAEAQDRDHVLAALGSAATQVRTRLGELPASVEKYDVPIFEATTSSLEALRVFSFGAQAVIDQGDDKAVPFFKQAIAIDPNFVLAYARLGASYGNVGEDKLAIENLNKAYAMRDRVSARESFIISELYYDAVRGDLPRAIQTDEQWARTYPSDAAAHFFAASDYASLGQSQKAVDEGRKALELRPDHGPEYDHLGWTYLAMNLPTEAKAVWEEGLRHGDLASTHLGLYCLAFFQKDDKVMAEQMAWGKQRVGVEDFFMQIEAETAAYYGHLQQAQSLWSRARESARRNGSEERAVWPELDRAFTEAEFGNPAEAERAARQVLKHTDLPAGRAIAGLILARTGKTKESARIADILGKENPSNTWLNYYWLPVIRAAIELHRGKAQKGLDLLAPATPYELGSPPGSVASLYPAYFRGQAYLALKQGDLAATEFQKVIDHRGLVLTGNHGALACLWLGRARALQAQQSHGEEAEHLKVQARTAYQDFLSLWKDADPDIPILKQATAEYARLR
jgi:eukaryotic-like serine/threonine-protein kinase